MWCHLRLYYLPLQPWWLSLLMLLSSVQTTSENFPCWITASDKGEGRGALNHRGFEVFFWKIIFIFVDFRPRSLPLWKSHHHPEWVAGAVTKTGSNTHFPLANTVSCVVEAHIQGLNWGGTVRWASEMRHRPTLIIWLKSKSWWVNVSTKIAL